MQSLLKIIGDISNWIWGIPMLIILVGGGVFLTVRLGFFQFIHFGYIMRQTFGKMFRKNVEGEGTVTPFQAATSALASTVGASNIVGVPVAIALGGPGAVLWMWITALIGSASKFSEVVLGLKYREVNEEGNYVGGPMYYIEKGLGWKFLSTLFALFLMLEIIPSTMVQANSVVGSAATLGISPIVTGIIVTLLVALVVVGGIKRIGSVAEYMVPFMALFYIIGALVVILFNIRELPGAIVSIFKYAFTPAAPVGGFAGATIAGAMRWGIARGVYSNEAGMGTAPMAHSAATIDHPVRQGFWGVFEVVVDTLIICTTTALVVLTTGIWKNADASKASSFPALAFSSVFGYLGSSVVTVSVLLFVISTIIVIIYYGEKQAEYLFGLAFSKVMRYIYLAAIFVGSIGGLKILWQFLDILLAMIVIPNMISVVLLSKDVKKLLDEFFSNQELVNK
ncbi:alanine/glycine:cation symporter family protein [Thermoanaerobacterium sp. DL9XJH110]|uniref:alanine/glycine:cation symporter family protein n=1 Tax=Thermoanaerobacterium sp. DL9XJH110 TaxID=3386643 RepID=UPI003BB71F9C